METQPQGYLHTKLDVKLLILFIMARIDTPLTAQEIYELAYQDDSLNYFVFAESLPELVESGHLSINAMDRYTITDFGREQGCLVEDSLAVPVVQKVKAAIALKQAQLVRERNITTSTYQDEAGNWITVLHYQDSDLPIMELKLMAVNEDLAKRMAKTMKEQADLLYKQAMDTVLPRDPDGKA